MNKKSTRRWAATAAAIVLTLAAGSWSLIRGHSSTRYRTVPAARGNLLLTVSATGNLNAVVTVQVGSQVSGNIMELNADFNSHVTKGQVVARIDPTLFQARVTQSEAALEAARISVTNARAQIEQRKAELAEAQANLAAASAGVLRAQAALLDAKVKYERRQTLYKTALIAKEDLETAQATYDTAVGGLDAAKAQESAARQAISAANAQVEVAQALYSSAQADVRQADAALAQARTDLDHTFIRAPVDGVVVARNVDVGQTVAASLQAPTLFQIAQDLTKMQVDTSVSEADIGKLQPGQPATFTVDAYPGRVFHGTVREIRKAPINVQNVITYDAVIAVDNPDLKLFPGMTATVRIVTGRRDDVLRVPNAALRFRPANAPAESPTRSRRAVQESVWILGTNGQPQDVRINTGVSDGTMTEITGGNLKPGDPVIVAALNPGSSSGSAPFAGGGPRGGPRF
jgi:HlyD family secretion protein